ncbi:uncharacterized protein Triagg1_6371 [Trichoderma aggressivum f. europaeum]|uniref:Helicase ATP-binding domain-containing protein n=1 Tax=Trichoderma aggressivum f. europaeum TaxID=173218 RepID=A0AAE1M1S9_9HYPO|nr:hypothetical protein Triagg1_6371 [Trichoderma aggressivum f. europaeum]
MEPDDDPHRHEAKRQRLDEAPSSHTSSFVRRAEEPGNLSPATYEHAPSLFTGELPVSTGVLSTWPPTWLPVQYPISVGFGYQPIFPIAPNFHAQQNYWTSQPRETLGLHGVGSYDMQFAANAYPCGFPNSVPWANPLSRVPMGSLALSNIHQAHGQLLQAEPLGLIQPPGELYPTSSYQAAIISEQSSESPSTGTCIDIVQEPDEVEEPQSNTDQEMLVCFGMISGISSCLQDITEGPELLDMLSSNVDLEETPQPKAIRAILQSHQKKALTFLLRREKGWAFDDHQSDIWGKADTHQGQFFVNRVSNTHQPEEPPQFYGGIIADPMGLGKTLTMISLAATDLDSDVNNGVHMDIDEEQDDAVTTTLIIVPPPLLGTWEEQLAEHVVEGSMVWRCHHGKSRFVDKSELDGVNVVLTTYYTVSAEWRTGNSILFSVRWRRIVLDEAHYIRNGTSRMAHSICALESVARWAVTGTPIQNRLADLSTLLRFIRAHPYTDPKAFDTDISRFWKSGKDEEAVRRLKHLSTSLLLRRPKATIHLPQRRDMRCPVDFSREERALYDEIREQAVSKIEEVLQNSSEVSRTGGYANVLQRVESLRLICDLGLYYHSRHQNLQHLMAEATDWASVAQETFNVQRGMGPMVCAQCSSTLELTETIKNLSTGIPSKVKALITDIRSLPPDTKCVVFSTWRLTLDVIKAGLDQASISSIRFDGKWGKWLFDRILLSWLTFPSLTLTVASRAYLMEPHWNPTLEEQALARIHRIGQTQEVTTVRFYMRDSFEEQVAELQESKKNLAGVLLSPHDGGRMDDSLGTLQTIVGIMSPEPRSLHYIGELWAAPDAADAAIRPVSGYIAIDSGDDGRTGGYGFLWELAVSSRQPGGS